MIRGIKEIFQEIVSTLPFNTLPKQFVIHLTYYIYMFLYCMTYSQGTSEHFYPRYIVTVKAIYYNKHCKAHLVSYIEAHDYIVVNNTQHPQTVPVVYLVPTGDIHSTLKLFDLNTGVVKKPRTITQFPMSERVITLVKKWANRYIIKITKYEFASLNRHKQKVDW